MLRPTLGALSLNGHFTSFYQILYTTERYWYKNDAIVVEYEMMYVDLNGQLEYVDKVIQSWNLGAAVHEQNNDS